MGNFMSDEVGLLASFSLSISPSFSIKNTTKGSDSGVLS